MKTKRHLLIIVVSLVVSAVSLVLILRDVPISEVVNSVSAADPFYLALALIFSALALIARGIRWRELLSRRLKAAEATHMVNVMFLGNQLPFRLGEVARSVLAKRAGVSLVTSAASIVVERLIDTLIVVIFIALIIAQLPDVPQAVADTTASFGILGILAFAVLLLMAHLPELANRLLSKLLGMFPPLNRLPLQAMMGNLLDGLQPLKTLSATISVGFWTIFAWLMSLATGYCLHLALGIEVNYAQSVPLGICLAALSLALPVSIAGLGPFEAAFLVAGRLVGMSDLEAIALGFVFHGVNLFSYVLWGILGLLALGISPTAVFDAAETDERDDS